MAKKSKIKPIEKITHECEFCKRTFSKEVTMIGHKCEKKRRWFNKNDPEARLAFMAWSRFYELNSKIKKENKKTYRDFIDSNYYIGFIKFGKFLIDANIISTEKYIDFVIKNSVPLSKWTNDSVYELFMDDLNRTETVEHALSRNIKLMQDWSSQTGEEWFDFFRKINPLLATSWILSGKISPWVLYNSESSQILFDRCGEEQLQLIVNKTKPHLWKIRFENNKQNVDWIKSTLQEAGI